MAWSDIVVRGSMDAATIDQNEVRRSLALLTDFGHAFEVRAVNPPGHAHGVVCRQVEDGLQAVLDHAGFAGVYVSINPIRPDAKSASKATVVARRWLLLDIDPVRPKDTSATEEEKAAGALVVGQVVDYIISLGGPAPVIGSSGNGWHIYYRVELPNDAIAQQIIKAAIHGLADRFDSSEAKIDRATHDAPRIARVPGTWARKGADTSERPHRQACLLNVPEHIEILSLDLLQRLGAKPEQNGKAHEPTPWSVFVADKSHDLSAYVRRAIEAECGKLAIAPTGTRNQALNSASFSLGQFAGWPEMDARQAQDALRTAALRTGLPASEVDFHIAHGWSDGASQPRPRPEQADATSSRAKALTPSDLIIGLDEIVPEVVDWYWENRVAPGFISLFAGRTGMGKSFVTCDYVARTSRGESPAYSSIKKPPLRTLFISEDPPNIMLGPRLLELGANTSHVKFMRFEAMSIWTLANLAMLDQAWQASGKPHQLVIDPPSNFLGDIDEHKNAALRGLLMPLVAWLDKHRVACIMITHLNKQVGKGIDAVGRIMGSVAWASTARITLAFDKDPDTSGQYLVGGSKNNLGPLADTLAYRIVKTPSLAKIEWVGQVDTSADDMVNQTPKKTRGASAVEWLIGIFRQKREWESDEIRRMAREAGISKYALWESPEVLALPIVKRRRINANGEQYWIWVADENWPSESSECRNLGAFDPVKKRKSEIPMRDSEVRKNQTVGISPQIRDSEDSEDSVDSDAGVFRKPEGYPDDWTYFPGNRKKDDS